MAQLFGYGIVALSMVPLIGFAGQVSLAQWSFAGIGAITMAHLGVGGTPMGIFWAVVVSGIVGALIALPTLRLSGIYLALATAAFAVFLDRWIFGLEAFNLPFTDVKIAIFGTGSLSVARLELFGYAFDTEYRQLMLLATAFGLVAIFVAWLRRSPFGRRLLAMKDSPAACATVGMNLMFTKLAVFAISAGIAGLGGALIGGLQRSTNSQNWEFAAGLPIFMVAVVGGIARIGGPLFAGISLATLAAIPTWPLLGSIPGIANITTVTPGFMGIGLGRNPNGAVADIREGFEPLPKRKIEFSLFLVSLAALYAIVLVADIRAWWFVVGGVTLLIGFTLVAGLRARPAPETEAAAGVEFADVPLEWVGIDRPFTPEDVARARRAARPRRGELMALLECRGITVRFGGHLALDQVDVEADAGFVTGLIGPNGAGKTTLFNVVCGLINPAGGSVRLDGRNLSSLAPYKRARLGHGAHVPTARAVRAALGARQRARRG